MPSKTVTVGSSVGLHARPAAIISAKAGELDADVTINGQVVTGYYLVNTVSGGKYEIADVPLAQGDMANSYLAESADEFSVIVIGYKSAKPTSAYAYPGGLNLKPINTG